MVKTTGVRSPTLGQLDTVSVLLFEGRTSCSTSYCFGITLRGKNFLLDELLLPRQEDLLLYESLLLRATGVSSTSHTVLDKY